MAAIESPKCGVRLGCAATSPSGRDRAEVGGSPWRSDWRGLYLRRGIPPLVLNIRSISPGVAGQRYHGTKGGILVYEKHCLFLSAGIFAHRKCFLLHKCLLCLSIQFFSSFSGINGVFKTCSVSVPQTLIHPACMRKNFLMGHLDQPALLATYGQKYWVTYLQTV